MKLTIQSTTKIVMIKPSPLADGVPARVWEGTSESGIKVHCYITRVAIPIDEQDRAEEFINELQECKPPSFEVATLPFRLILD